MFGWPMVPSADLPGGGPAYPLSALGVRGRWRPIDPLTFLVGVFNGSPVAQQRSAIRSRKIPRAPAFRSMAARLVIAEMQYSYPALGSMVYADQSRAAGRASTSSASGTTARDFADLRFDNTGLSLANPASTGMPQQHHGDYSIYARRRSDDLGSIRTRADRTSTSSPAPWARRRATAT